MPPRKKYTPEELRAMLEEAEANEQEEEIKRIEQEEKDQPQQQPPIPPPQPPPMPAPVPSPPPVFTNTDQTDAKITWLVSRLSYIVIINTLILILLIGIYALWFI